MIWNALSIKIIICGENYKVKKLEHGILKYNRTKTKGRRSDEAYIEVRIHPFIKKLMAKWKGSGGYVFNFRKRFKHPEDFNRSLNVGLKTIGDELHMPGLQFYQARHTFATLSRNMMKFSKSDVDEALNHVGSYDIADVYITKDFSIINENNFKLIYSPGMNANASFMRTLIRWRKMSIRW